MKWLFPECRKTVPKEICSLTASDIFTRCNLVFTQDAAGNLSLDCALTAGGRIVARKDTLTGTVTGYSGTLFISGLS